MGDVVVHLKALTSQKQKLEMNLIKPSNGEVMESTIEIIAYVDRKDEVLTIIIIIFYLKKKIDFERKRRFII